MSGTAATRRISILVGLTMIVSTLLVNFGPTTVYAINTSPRVFTTTYGSFDIPIASYDVTEYGATPNDAIDDTSAFQNALNAAGNAGGGVVFAPTGKYKIATHLTIPLNVTLRGDWRSPEAGAAVGGTILQAYEGRDNAGGTPFISLLNNSMVRDLSIWYPDQNDINNIHAYPWTIANYADGATGYYSTNISDITLVNSYQGINIDWHNCYTIRNVYGTVLKRGIQIDRIYDIGRLETVWLRPKYWANSGLGSPPTETNIRTWQLNNEGIGLVWCKDDWSYLYDMYLEGYHQGILFGQSASGTYNGQIAKLRIENGRVGIQINTISSIGVVISNSIINTSVSEGISVFGIANGFVDNQSIQFNSCTIGSPSGTPVRNEGTGLMSFVHCTFTDWSSSHWAIEAVAGTIVATGNTFAVDKPDMKFFSGVSSAAVTNNAYANNTPNVTNLSSGDTKIDYTGSPSSLPLQP